MRTIILSILLALPAYHADRDDSPEQRRVLLEPIAAAQAEACAKPPPPLTPTTCLAALIAVAKHETEFARYVLEGRCEDGPKGQRCDWDARTGKPRARGAYQLWEAACPEAYRYAAGSPESTELEAQCAVRLLAGAYLRCRGRHAGGDWAGMFAGYRSADCSWEGSRSRGARARVRTMQWVTLRLESAE